MNKRILLGGLAVLALGVLAFLAVSFFTDPARDKVLELTEQEVVEARQKLMGPTLLPPAEATLAPIGSSRAVRLAIGGLGLGSDDQDRRLGDLVLVGLADAKGLELVERGALDVALRELQLSLSGFVRAQDAVRAGRILRADWFLLGTPAALKGTNYLVVRIVDGRTGVLRETGVFAAEAAPSGLATELGRFVRQCRQNAAEAKAGVYLSVGSFEDLSLNNRLEGLPRELRSYLAAAYQHGNVTMLEREFVNMLRKEVQLELAGLTDDVTTNAPVMQSAYWMVDGYYQSFDGSGAEVELVLSIRRLLGRTRQFTLRDKPGEPLFRRITDTVDGEMRRDRGAVVFSRTTELRTQMANGKEIFHAGQSSSRGTDLIWLSSDHTGRGLSESEIARRRRNNEEAIRAFETVLLLDPKHREAKLYLAACYRQFFVQRMEEARTLYRELIEEGVNDPLTTMACQALNESFRWTGAEEKLRWFEAANQTHPHTFYQSQVKAAQETLALGKTATPEAEQLAEQKLVEDITKWERQANQGAWTLNFGSMGFENFVAAFGTNRVRAAERLAALLPRMQAASSNLAPYLVAGTVVYQVETNVPVVAQFEKSLEEAAAHPEKLFGASNYFSMVSAEVFNWAVAKKLDLLAARTKEARERMARQKFASPLDADERMGMAFAFLGGGDWQKALDVFQTYSNRPVLRGFSGAHNDPFMPVLTGPQANFCRKKLGLPVHLDPREFEMGTNCLCLHAPSVIQPDGSGLWVATGDQLLRLGLDLKTNFVVRLPTGGSAPTAVLLPGVSNLWIGTDGAGLIEFDKASRACRRLTVKDGLMMDSISALHLVADTLWIGYGNAEGGGLGRLDVKTGAVKSFTPSLADGTDAHRFSTGNMVLEDSSKPPHRLIKALASGPGGEICFSTEFHPLRQYRPKDNAWSTSPVWSGTCVTADAKRLLVGSYGEAPVLGVVVWDFESGKTWGFKEVDGLPCERVSALTLDGENVWIGGFGFIARADAKDGSVRKLAYVPAEKVDQIQIGGGFVWAVFERHLHRAPLPRG